MLGFTYYTPTKVAFGKGSVERVGELMKQFGGTRVLIHYGGQSAVRSGVLDRVKKSLDEAGIFHVELGGVVPNPHLAKVREGIELARKENVDVIFPVGGGSAIDCAKAIAFGVPYEGDVWDFFSKKATIAECLPIACVLTIPAAGSEGSSSCVISNDELGLKCGTNSNLFRPKVAFLDPELTFTLPPYQTAAGVTDMIAHVCERYFSGTGSSSLTDNIATGIIRSLIDEAPVALAEPENYEARANIMWAGTLAHNDIAGCGLSATPTSRAGGWESHALEHELSAFDTSITHGAGLAVVMPAWMRFVWRENPARFLKFALQVFDIEPIDETDEAIEDAVTAAIDELQAFFVDLGMPRTLGEFGIAPEDVDKLLSTLKANKGEVFGGFKKLTLEDAKAIYLSAF
mgnify:CR=1 FL=1